MERQCLRQNISERNRPYTRRRLRRNNLSPPVKAARIKRTIPPLSCQPSRPHKRLIAQTTRGATDAFTNVCLEANMNTKKQMNLRWQGFLLLIVLALLSASSGICNAQSRDREPLARFEKQLEELRTLLKVPGLSAVIVRNQQVLWAKAFGFADVEKRVPATSQTPYRIASLTKTFAATLVLQLVEQGKLNLDEPMSKYSSDFKDTRVKIKHLLSQTSQGTPGERYQYNGAICVSHKSPGEGCLVEWCAQRITVAEYNKRQTLLWHFEQASRNTRRSAGICAA